MKILLSIVSFYGTKNLLLLVISILKLISTKTDNKYDDNFVKELEKIIKYIDEYSKTL